MAMHSPGRILLFSATALLAAATALAQSPGGMPQQQQPMPSQPASPGMSAPDSMPGSATTAQQFGDQSFVAKEIAGGEAEVEMGQLAQQKSQSNDVKQLAQKMVSDHSQMGDKWFKPVAKQIGASIPKTPDKKDKKLIAKMQALSGQDFDNQYLQELWKGHQKDLKDFKEEAQTTQDPNLKQVAQQGATIIQQHLQLIEQVAKNHNVPVEGKEVSSM